MAGAVVTEDTSSSDFPFVSGDMKKQITNATAVSTAPKSIVVPVPSAEILSGSRYVPVAARTGSPRWRFPPQSP